MSSKNKRMSVLKSVDEIPKFSSHEEEAAFWQTHSPVAILDQLRPADDVAFVPTPKRLIPLPLDERLYEQVRRQARRQGVSVLTLIQRWVERSVELSSGKVKSKRPRGK